MFNQIRNKLLFWLFNATIWFYLCKYFSLFCDFFLFVFALKWKVCFKKYSAVSVKHGLHTSIKET